MLGFLCCLTWAVTDAQLVGEEGLSGRRAERRRDQQGDGEVDQDHQDLPEVLVQREHSQPPQVERAQQVDLHVYENLLQHQGHQHVEMDHAEGGAESHSSGLDSQCDQVFKSHFLRFLAVIFSCRLKLFELFHNYKNKNKVSQPCSHQENARNTSTAN